MNGYGVALALTAIWFTVVYVVLELTYFRAQRKIVAKYPLFAIRDRLMELRLSGAFEDNDDLYHYLSDLCNQIIRNLDKFTLWTYLASLNNLDDDCEAVAYWTARVEDAPEVVRDTEVAMWRIVQKVLYGNSLVIRLLDRMSVLRNIIESKPFSLREHPLLLPVRQYVRIREFQPDVCLPPMSMHLTADKRDKVYR